MASHKPLTLLVAALSTLAAGNLMADENSVAREFTLRVLPLLKSKCFACHGNNPSDVKGQFNIRSRSGMLQGGESNQAAIVPGHPSESPLILSVRWDGLEMPPKENDRLTNDQIRYLERWIAAGAPWPDSDSQKKFRDEEWATQSNTEGILMPNSGGLTDDWTYRRYQPQDVWAFRPLKQPAPATQREMANSPIDFFINRKLASAGLEPANRADSLTLVRRATYDLTGLPPSPEEIHAFESEFKINAETAWSNLIDRLLASPHYGERWAQHWLDVTRYSDTGGMANDFERSNMWRYRDYVIRSFNDDKPYDQFVIEQLAGDELADASVRQRSNGNEDEVRKTRSTGTYNKTEAEQIVASSFLRMGAWDNAMVETDEARQIYLDDLVNNVGQTFLSTTLRCCKCHDHKFDPLPTRDYYRIYAALATTQLAERSVPFLPSENLSNFEDGKTHVQRMLNFAVAEKDRLEAKRESAAKAWFDEQGLPYKDEKARKNLPDEEKPPRHVGLDYSEQGQLKVREQDEWIWTRRLERYEPMAQSVYNAEETQLAWNGARKLRISAKAKHDNKLESYILTGGSLSAKGDAVKPGVLSATGIPVVDAIDKLRDSYLLSESTDGRRLGLAKWIASPNNPLTARSFVNRVWQHHFVHGIARNPNNFGAKGAMPTHPELLDWLAGDFINNGWTVKRLHRRIMLSSVYQQASMHSRQEQLRDLDPNNNLLAYFPSRRLTAEELRDSMLTVTGELNSVLGGLPAMPEINMEVALQPRMIQFSLAPAYQPSPTPSQRNRRTIYAYRVRGQADPFLELFNQPNSNESCEARETAAVTPQVFTLLNSDIVTDRSIAFALRLQNEKPGLNEQVDRAFALAWGRQPSHTERSRMVTYIKDMQRYHQKVPAAHTSYPTEITRSLVEEFTGQPFKYTEILPAFHNYQADRKSADVSPMTRAIADMCLLLFNANQFIYMR